VELPGRTVPYADAMDRLEIAGRAVELTLGDITAVPTDAIVNAANSSLAGGGGVDGAIHRTGGPEVMADLEARYGKGRRCPTGSAVISVAGRLPTSWVIHAVGPVWQGGHTGEPELLASAYRTSLQLAAEQGARTVTAPAISLGIYGYPHEPGARVALETALEYLGGETPIQRVIFVLRPDTFPVFGEVLADLAGRDPR
jgi:O-acetyl-ADP-ribose deacetylase (regulator of RNase III)